MSHAAKRARECGKNCGRDGDDAPMHDIRERAENQRHEKPYIYTPSIIEIWEDEKKYYCRYNRVFFSVFLVVPICGCW
jgi:hypothetical protein